MNLCWLSFHHSFLRKKSKKNDFIENLIQKIIQKFVMKLNNYSPAFLNSEFEWKTSKIHLRLLLLKECLTNTFDVV